MHPISVLKRVAARWEHRTTQVQYTEQGDTLVEVLLAMVILGIASVALLAGFATSIAASAEHRNLAFARLFHPARRQYGDRRR